MNPLYLHADGYEPERTIILGQDFGPWKEYRGKLVSIEVDENMPNDEIHVLDSQGQITRIVKINLDSMQVPD